MSTPPTRNVYTIRPLPSGGGARGSLSTSISMGPHGLVHSLYAASPTPPTRHHLDANASTLSASPRTSRIRRDFTSLGRHPLANDGDENTTFGDDEEDSDDWTIVDKLRMWRHDAMMQHLYDTLLPGDPNDAFWLAQTHFLTNQYSRAERLLTRPFNFSAAATRSKGTGEQPLDMIQGEGISRLVDVSVACRYLASGNWTEAMEMLGDSNPFAGSSNSGSKIPNSDGGIKVEASMCYLRGLLMLRLNRADRAKECLLEALALDVKCYEAFELLVGGEMMGIDEEWALIEGLAYREQAQEQAEFVKLMYTTRLKKFKHHAEIEAARKKLMEEYDLADNPDVMFGHADSLYAEYRWADCFAITSRILDLEAVHPSTLPLHLACMTALPHLHSRLFLLAHELVAHESDAPSSWYAVGLWYLLLGPRVTRVAHVLCSKTSLMDPRFGPAWIAFAHAFAYEGEHDQAIVAYSTSARLFPGSHLPQLFIGMEHIQLSNMQLAESHLAASVALCDSDPILFNELGVVAYENRKYDDALKHFSNAVSRAREVRGSQTMWATLYVNQAHAFRKIGYIVSIVACLHLAKLFPSQLQEAKEGYMRVLEIEPRHTIAIASLGLTHHLLFELEDAIARYHEALAIEPLAAHVVGLLDSALHANSDVPIYMIPGLGKDGEWEAAMEQRNRAQEAHRAQRSQTQEDSNAANLSGISEADSSAMDLVS
ncbi:cell division control protein 16 [Rhizoctonia solani AG-1 IA]|uniref:Cell division control protein 16 n=1 Tax=Thanatephorus cucumeris (strain AG1-IA) TaxID=983506 RepID=L8WVC4_THACA|nr:cell division control protein 16 [Rhizoctonia solani AG-1 IA]